MSFGTVVLLLTVEYLGVSVVVNKVKKVAKKVKESFNKEK